MDSNIINAALSSITTIVASFVSLKKAKSNTVSIPFDELVDLQSKIMSVQNEAYKLLEDNYDLKTQIRILKAQIEEKESVVRHKEKYITKKDDLLEIKYCSTCYGKCGLFIQLEDDSKDKGSVYCPVCKETTVVDSALNSSYFKSLNSGHDYDPYDYYQ